MSGSPSLFPLAPRPLLPPLACSPEQAISERQSRVFAVSGIAPGVKKLILQPPLNSTLHELEPYNLRHSHS